MLPFASLPPSPTTCANGSWNMAKQFGKKKRW
jgi:hypothetical protein